MEHSNKFGTEGHSQKHAARVRTMLETAGIDTTDWGSRSAKTLEHLVREVASGECELVIDDETGILVRRVAVLDADVLYCQPDGEWLVLVEEKQVFSGGRERQRNLDCSVAEKLSPGEDVELAASRALSEELGIKHEPDGLYDIGTDRKLIDSPSYPGLATEYTVHRRVVVMSEAAYVPSGYREDQSDKSTFFVWKPAKE